jgi:hypothetical protein
MRPRVVAIPQRWLALQEVLMRARVPPLLLASVLALSACAGRASGPPALAYRLPDPTRVSYAVGDTALIEIDALGQSLTLEAKSVALYGVSFERAGDGIRATLDIEDLEAEINVPMAGPMRVDESIVSGGLVVMLGRRGDVTIVESPEVEEAASQFFSGPTIAHAFFPGLPGTVVRAGDNWVDTVAYSDAGETGEASQSSVLTYTVIGDTSVDGRSLLEIDFAGTSESRQTMDLQGVGIEQSMRLQVEGRMLWDLQRGLMFESETTSTGTGSVRIAVAPAPLPTRVQTRQRLRLEAP